MAGVDPLHTVEDVADAFSLSPNTVRDLAKRHDWPHVRLGRAIRFTDAQVAWIVALHTQDVSEEVRLMRSTGLTRGSAQHHLRQAARWNT